MVPDFCDAIVTSAPACFSAFCGSVNSTCSTPFVARIAIFRPDSVPGIALFHSLQHKPKRGGYPAVCGASVKPWGTCLAQRGPEGPRGDRLNAWKQNSAPSCRI